MSAWGVLGPTLSCGSIGSSQVPQISFPSSEVDLLGSFGPSDRRKQYQETCED